MPHAIRLAAAALSVVLLSAAGWAQADPLPVNFAAGGATDYVFRGVSQTREHGQVFGSVEADIGPIGYAGVWASNVDLPGGADAEIDLVGGVRPKVGPVTVDLGFVHYGYTGRRSGPGLDYTELKVAPSMQLGPATFGAAWYHSEDFFGRSGPANYLEANASLPLGASPFSVSCAVGRQEVKGPGDYTTWNLGVGYAVGAHLGFDLRYWDTDAHDRGSIFGSRVVLGLKATFP
jgi:uncharacterized protein (TIGR02001 family)